MKPDHLGSRGESCSIVQGKALGITSCWPILTTGAIEDDAPISSLQKWRVKKTAVSCHQSHNKSRRYPVMLSFVRPREKAEL